MDAVQGVIATLIAVAVVICTFFFGQYTAQLEVKRKCEQFQVIDLDQAKAMFYCTREKP